MSSNENYLAQTAEQRATIERLEAELAWAAFQAEQRRSLHGGFALIADRLAPFREQVSG